MKVLCNLEGKGFGGVLTQQVSEYARLRSTACEDVWQHSFESQLHYFHGC